MSAVRRSALVVLAAVLGIVFAAAITWGTSQLVRQRIGLASEPLTAGQRLLPTLPHTSVHRTTSGTRSQPSKPSSSTHSQPVSPTPTVSSAPVPTTEAQIVPAPVPAPSRSSTQGRKSHTEPERERSGGELKASRKSGEEGDGGGSGGHRDD